MAQPEPDEVEEATAIPELHSVVEGTVASVRPFGAFIRIGKGDKYKDGLVHISAIAPGRVEKVSDYLDVGDKVWAKVVHVKEEEGKYGLDLRYVNQQSGRDLDPKNREGRFPQDGGKQKKTKTEDLVKDAKAVMEEVKRMKKESKLKKKFLKMEEKRKKKLQKKIKAQAKARGEKIEDDDSSSSSSSTSSLSEATQTRLRKEFGFPEPVKKVKKAKEAQENGKGPGIMLKERKDVPKPGSPPKSKAPKAAVEDRRPPRRRDSRSPGARYEPPDSRSPSPRRRARRDSRGDSRRDSRGDSRGDSRRRRARARGRSRRSRYAERSKSPEPPRRSRAKAKVEEESHKSDKRISSQEKRRLYASGVADGADPPKQKGPKVAKQKAKEPVETKEKNSNKKEKESTKQTSKRSKQEDPGSEEPPKKAKRSKKKDAD